MADYSSQIQGLREEISRDNATIERLRRERESYQGPSVQELETQLKRAIATKRSQDEINAAREAWNRARSEEQKERNVNDYIKSLSQRVEKKELKIDNLDLRQQGYTREELLERGDPQELGREQVRISQGKQKYTQAERRGLYEETSAVLDRNPDIVVDVKAVEKANYERIVAGSPVPVGPVSRLSDETIKGINADIARNAKRATEERFMQAYTAKREGRQVTSSIPPYDPRTIVTYEQQKPNIVLEGSIAAIPRFKRGTVTDLPPSKNPDYVETKPGIINAFGNNEQVYDELTGKYYYKKSGIASPKDIMFYGLQAEGLRYTGTPVNIVKVGKDIIKKGISKAGQFFTREAKVLVEEEFVTQASLKERGLIKRQSGKVVKATPYDSGLSKEIRVRPVTQGQVYAESFVEEGKTLQLLEFKLGKPQYVIPEKIPDIPAYMIKTETATIGLAKKSNIPGLIRQTKGLGSTTAEVVEADQFILSEKNLQKLVSGSERRGNALRLVRYERSLPNQGKYVQTGRFEISPLEESSQAFKKASGNTKQAMRLDQRPSLFYRPEVGNEVRPLLRGSIRSDVTLESGYREVNLFVYDRPDIMRNLYGTVDNPVFSAKIPPVSSFYAGSRTTSKIVTTPIKDSVVSGGERVVAANGGSQESVLIQKVKTKQKSAMMSVQKESSGAKQEYSQESSFFKKTRQRQEQSFLYKEGIRTSTEASQKQASRQTGSVKAGDKLKYFIKSLGRQSQRQSQLSKSFALSGVGTSVLSNSKEVSATDVRSLSLQKSLQDVKSITDVRSLSLQKSLQLSKQASIQRYAYDAGYDFPNIPRIRIPKLPSIIKSESSSMNMGGGQAYAAFVKRKGRFVKVSGPVIKSDAYDVGARVAVQTLAATFKVRKVSGVAKDIPTGNEFSKYRSQFRDYQISKGSQVPLPEGTYIQRRNKRLSTRSEVSELRSAISPVRKKQGIRKNTRRVSIL